MSEGIEIAEEGAVVDLDDAATGEAVRADLNAQQRSQMRAVWEWVFVVVIAIGAALFIRVFLFQQRQVQRIILALRSLMPFLRLVNVRL